MNGRVIVTTVVIYASREQDAALRAVAARAGLSREAVLQRISQAAQDAAGREMARLTTPGPESAQGWQQRCNACRVARAEECATCANLGLPQAGAVAGEGASLSPVKTR